MTPFTRRVYAVVAAIPPGHVLSYGDVAALAGRPRAPRAVGGVLSTLSDDMTVPWWRVVSGTGKVSTSTLHHTAQIQRAMLEDEGVVFSAGGRIDWDRFGWSAEDEVIERMLQDSDT